MAPVESAARIACEEGCVVALTSCELNEKDGRFCSARYNFCVLECGKLVLSDYVQSASPSLHRLRV